MTDTQAVARWEKRTPDELIAEGRTQATALMKVVKEAGLAKDLGGQRPHLEVEAWQTIGRFNGFLTDIAWTRPVVEGGEKVGYEARAELVRIDDGQHLIGAEASCFFNEVLTRKDGTEVERWTDDYSCRSMAQTRAQSKVGRMAFAWVAVLAGYSGTPAEEMEGVRGRGRAVVFPFGPHKDKQPSDLTADDLHKLLPFWESKAKEEGKFQANNQRLLDAIKAALAEKTASTESPAAPETAPVEAASTATDAAPAGDTSVPAPQRELSELDKAWVRVDELRTAAKLSSNDIAKWAREKYGKDTTKQSMSLLQVQALIAYLVQQPGQQGILV